MPSFESHPTPNPNSLKFTTDAGPFIEAGMASYNSATEARGDALATSLFAIEGIANVFILPQFLTVTKSGEAGWDAMLDAIHEALNRYFEEKG